MKTFSRLFFVYLLSFSIAARATDYQVCNSFLSVNETSKYLRIGSDGSVQLNDKVMSKIVHFNRVEGPDGSLNHYEILMSHKKNGIKGASPKYLDDVINVWLNSKKQVSIIERSNNYNGTQWNGNDFHLIYGGHDECGVFEEGSFSYEMKTQEKKHATIFNARTCLTLIQYLKANPEINACLHEMPKAGAETKNCLAKKNVQQTVQEILIANPPDVISLSENAHFTLLSCETPLVSLATKNIEKLLEVGANGKALQTYQVLQAK